MTTPRILVVDDHPEMVALLEEQLKDEGYEVLPATTGAAALDLARRSQPDAALTDLRMAGVDGFDVLGALRELDPDMPVLIMTAFGTIDSAVDAMRRGAWTYLTKPFRTDELLLQLQHAVAHRALGAENRALRRLTAGDAPDGMVGRSQAMRSVYGLVARLADADVPVLVRGESGTGKERVARALHAGGRRRTAPFVVVNCASVPGSLLESELFGHVKGSFTGATAQRRGLFVEADGGTLFLDEIGDMPLELQAHLLRVIEDRMVRPVGADAGRRVDVRIVAATHQDLEALVAEGRFRADLFFRLDVVPMVLPPLRERIEDLPSLVVEFLARCGPTPVQRLSPAALAALERHDWPGNVRELENLVRRLALLVDHAVIELDDLAVHAPQIASAPARAVPLPSVAEGELCTLRELEQRYIAHVIDRCEGNKTRAAEVLGIDVSTIHRRMRSDR